MGERTFDPPGGGAGIKVTHSDSEQGKATVQKGTLIKLLTVQDEEGRSILALFPDWQQIRLWTMENVDTLVLPAKDAWGFATMTDTFAGIVINPAGHALALTLNDLETLGRDTEQTAGTDAAGRGAAQP